MTLRKKLSILLLLALLLTGLPAGVRAQEPDEPLPLIDWQEVQTEYFIIVYADSIELDGVAVDCPACGPQPAAPFAASLDNIYQELAAVFETELEIPINIQLFPTEESYYRVNPIAGESDTVTAHNPHGRGEIAIALPRLAELNPNQITNKMRHELSHLFASYLSDGKLNTGFQEGTAQYLEKPDELTAQKVELLRQAHAEDRLFTWAEIKEPQIFADDPKVAYPQAMSMVSFLIDRYGMATYLKFLKTTATEPGYRSALEAAYDIPADDLETEWQAYLPDYLDQRWQINAVYAYDISDIAQLVAQGAYSDAEAKLVETIALLQTTDQTETLAQAEALLNRIRQGQMAGTLADETYRAVQAGNYAEAIEKGNAAVAAYNELGYQERIPEIQTYIHRAEVGLQALDQLARGEALFNSLNFFQAEKEIYDATVLLQALNNQAAAQRGIDLLQRSAERQRFLAYALVGVGVILFLFNLLHRVYNRFTANPLEVEFK